MVKTRLSEDKLKGKLQKYPRPANIAELITPRINPLIWGQISSNTQQSDAKSQKAQHTLIGAASAIVKSVDHVLKTDSSNKELVSMLTDALAFVLQCNHDTNHLRRLALKKDLHKDFAALCNVNTPAGEYLFGDLSKLTKEISEANKLAKKVNQPKTKHDIPTAVKDILANQPAFTAGRLRQHLSAWQELTCDHTILQCVHRKGTR